ncbi:MAG: bifunctional 23S rRNA (guanine(2069)-N(7))-methyltransferase RlmK/23S rRNA (guanine(2445)-N(2))-methyltransferase RlmL [Desulforhopalus sp.]
MVDKNSQKTGSYEFVAGCGGGLEELVQGEVLLFGGQEITCGNGVVSWQGGLETGYRCCLWSRFASRVFTLVARFPVTDEESLYTACLEIDWQAHLSVDRTFAVSCTLSKDSPITHNRFAAFKVKDALVDQFRELMGERPSVRQSRPDVQIHLHIEGNIATASIDLSGESLHRRGYRSATSKAPLKETLGAAIVALSGWPGKKRSLIDPMCGTGTLLIEAALMFGESAPGLSRNYFGFSGWLGHDEELWSRLVAEAMEKEERGLEKDWPQIIGYDADPVAVSAARKNIEMAGLEEYIQIKQAEIATLQPPDKEGLLLCNLPYGERLSEKELVERLYRGYGRILRQRFPGWQVAVFISNPELTDSFTLNWDGRYKLYNGSIRCRLLTGTVSEKDEPPFIWHPSGPEQQETASEFGNRLRKNLRKILKWAEREGISCFRIYDRDLPDYNLSIDLYSKWAHIQEYAPPKNIDRKVAASRLDHAVRSVKEILGLRSNRLFLKTRERQRGRTQYEKKNNRRKMYEVKEGDCSYLVNFTDYLDTGLFLDHRPVRQKIHQLAKGKRFLNLFGYTGTATVQAAIGGAAATTTVDLSSTYVDWTRMNLALNGFAELRHRVERADCMQWLSESKATFDLIFIDPPTFSNTKKEKRVFDVQSDHLQLINLAMSRLEDDGLLIFSTNFRRFKLSEEIVRRYEVKDISRESVPFDFARNTKIHKCWEIRRSAV